MTELEIRVPGKVMLCGEYFALVRGAKALAFALDTWLEVYVRYGTTKRAELTLHSDIWDTPRLISSATDSDDMLVDTVCKLFPAGEHTVEEIRITSKLNPKHGFGSSSALRLGLVFASYLQGKSGRLIIPPAKRWQLAGDAFALQRERQGQASGYDVATQFLGSIVEYDSHGGEWDSYSSPQSMRMRLPDEEPDTGSFFYTLGGYTPEQPYEVFELEDNLRAIVHIFIGGEGADTTTVMRDTLAWLENQSPLPLLKASPPLYHAFRDAIKKPNDAARQELIKRMANWRRVFAKSPHFPRHIAKALRKVSGLDRNWSWKTSGAGGEDALLVVGLKEDIRDASTCLAELGWQRHDYAVAERGVCLQRPPMSTDANPQHSGGMASATPTPFNRKHRSRGR